jgi:DNA-binding transcriptional ArsR family regulator
MVVYHCPVPDYELADRLEVSTDQQLKAFGNLTRHRILGELLDKAATATQLAGALGVHKASVSFHLRVLAGAGLVREVRTRQVRGVVERYYGRTARTYDIVTDSDGRGLPLRTALAELTAAPHWKHEVVSTVRVRLPEDRQAELRCRLEALLAELDAAAADSDNRDPQVNLTVAMFRP